MAGGVRKGKDSGEGDSVCYLVLSGKRTGTVWKGVGAERKTERGSKER